VSSSLEIPYREFRVRRDILSLEVIFYLDSTERGCLKRNTRPKVYMQQKFCASKDERRKSFARSRVTIASCIQKYIRNKKNFNPDLNDTIRLKRNTPFARHFSRGRTHADFTYMRHYAKAPTRRRDFPVIIYYLSPIQINICLVDGKSKDMSNGKI